MGRKISAALLGLLLLASFPGCGRQGKTKYQAEFLQLFDTVTQVVAYTGSRQEFDGLAEFLRSDLERYHRLFDIYKEYEGINNLKTLNDNAGIAPVQLDREILDMLEFSRTVARETGGACNAALGPVLQLWHQSRTQGIDDPRNAALPAMESLREAAAHTDMELLELDFERGTAFLPDASMRLDVGATAKGYAAQRVSEHLREAGLGPALLSVGGNICAIGAKDGRDQPWDVGILDPEGGGTLLTISLPAGYSVVTSGTYQRYYTVDGTRYHHIIDPGTLMPARHVEMVTVACPDSGLADALSTALFNMPYQQARAFSDNLDDVHVLWMLQDGTLQYTGGFGDMIQ